MTAMSVNKREILIHSEDRRRWRRVETVEKGGDENDDDDDDDFVEDDDDDDVNLDDVHHDDIQRSIPFILFRVGGLFLLRRLRLIYGDGEGLQRVVRIQKGPHKCLMGRFHGLCCLIVYFLSRYLYESCDWSLFIKRLNDYYAAW